MMRYLHGHGVLVIPKTYLCHPEHEGIVAGPLRIEPQGAAYRFEPGCDIDPITEYICPFDDDVAEIDAFYPALPAPANPSREWTFQADTPGA